MLASYQTTLQCCIPAWLSLATVRPIHFLSPTIIHGLLLLLQLTNALADCQTVWHWAAVVLALPRVDLQQSPDSLAHIATTNSLNLALRTMFQQPFHLSTICRWTCCRGASSSMLKQCHVQLNTSLPFLTLSSCELIWLPTCNRNGFERMGMARNGCVLDTIVTLIKVSTRWAVKAIPL